MRGLRWTRRTGGSGTWCGTRRTTRELLSNVEAVEVHHLGPGGDKVVDELLPRVGACIDFRQGPKLGVGPEDEIHTRSGPLQLTELRSRPSNTPFPSAWTRGYSEPRSSLALASSTSSADSATRTSRRHEALWK